MNGNGVSLKKLFSHIFVEGEYDKMVRPFGNSNLTEIKTELKLLQIDLVTYY